MERRKLVIVGVLVIITVCFGVFVVPKLNIFQSNSPALAASGSVPLSSQSDWETGSHATVNTATSPGSVTLNSSPADAWSSKNTLPTARFGLGSASYSDLAYAIGGCKSNGGGPANLYQKNEAYDPVANTWSTKTDMPTLRGGLAVAEAAGKIYALGGFTSAGGAFMCYSDIDSAGFGTIISNNEEYDPIANTWATKAPLPTARQGLSAASLNGKIYTFGGFYYDGGLGHGVGLNTVEEYDPASDTWSTKASMPNHRWGTAAAVVNGKIYVVGGLTYDAGVSGKVNFNQEYDPVNNTWTTKADMPIGSIDLSAVTLNNKVYAMGGINGGGVANYNDAYDPVSDTWSSKAVMPAARNAGSVALVNTQFYYIGGADGASAPQTNNYQYPNSYTYSSPGTHTSAATQITDTNLYQWQTFTATYTKPANTDVSFKFRTSTDASTWTSWTASQTPASGTPLTISALVTSSTGPPGGETFYKYIQVETTLTSYDGVATPTLDDYTIGFHTNVAPSKPTAATAVIAP